MANLNDYKMLALKSSIYFSQLENEIGKITPEIDEINKERFGFYFFVLEMITGVKELDEILEMITDMDFHAKIYRTPIEDFGIDAIHIDEDEKIIDLFNFKYREKFDPNREQSKNESIASLKFINAVISGNIKEFKGKIKNFAEEIINCLNGKEAWNIRLFIISNENKTLSSEIQDFKSIKDMYDIDTVTIGLNELLQYISLRPDPINAVLHLSNDTLFPFVESTLSTSKSFVFRISADELIRITCNNEQYRNDYQMEDYTSLSNQILDYNVLFDNVRGFVIKSKFNKKMAEELDSDPQKFFMYNNGMTITATDISSESTNANKKTKLTITDFQVVNGGQTLRTLHNYNQLSSDNILKLSKCEVLVRLFKTNSKSKERNKIAEYTNSQNAINLKDLKSLSEEQIALENYLDDNKIIYARKYGDTGISEKEYSHKISMEKCGQILFAVYGFPERASNYKKEIFEKYYDDLFIKNDVQYIYTQIQQYFEIKEEYKKISKYKVSEQKIFYILYLDNLGKLKDFSTEIDFLEKQITSYKKNDDISDSRKLILIGFREALTKSYMKKLKQSIK